MEPSRRDSFVGERPDPAGVTEEHLPGPKTAGLRQGRSPTSPLSQSAVRGVRGGSVLGRYLVDMTGFDGYTCVSGRVTRSVT